MTTQWFDVDRSGLARIAARRNKLFILRELLQNAWDEASTEVRVQIAADVAGYATVRVTDDAPDGFHDLTHAYTLFAQSKKLSNPTARGRFNFGEKLVLALCLEARIETTTGTVIFDRGEQRRRSPKRRAAGSMFEGRLRLTREERAALEASAKSMLVPEGKRTFVNDEEIAPRTPIASFEWTLPTEQAGTDGMLRDVHRSTSVRLFEPAPGERASLYEMGIPVVETGDRWHVDVGQKVPLNIERENVTPSYLRTLRVAVANHTRELLTVEDANTAWARDALADDQCEPDTARALVRLRFGDRAVIHDPSDHEANNLAVAQGYTLVHGSQLSASEWQRVRESKAILPAGQVTPSPKPFTPGGAPLRMLDAEKWTPEITRFVRLASAVGEALTGHRITVEIANDRGWGFAGCYGSSRLIANLAMLGRPWFDPVASERQLDFLIHEFGHDVCGNHLDARYHDALTRFGARLARLAIEHPEIFK